MATPPRSRSRCTTTGCRFTPTPRCASATACSWRAATTCSSIPGTPSAPTGPRRLHHPLAEHLDAGPVLQGALDLQCRPPGPAWLRSLSTLNQGFSPRPGRPVSDSGAGGLQAGDPAADPDAQGRRLDHPGAARHRSPATSSRCSAPRRMSPGRSNGQRGRADRSGHDLNLTSTAPGLDRRRARAVDRRPRSDAACRAAGADRDRPLVAATGQPGPRPDPVAEGVRRRSSPASPARSTS